MEKKMLRIFLLVGIGLLPVAIYDKNNQTKNWIIVFFLKGFISSILDTVLVKQKRVKYQIRLFPQYFQINVLFDYLLFPVICVFYNKLTYRSSISEILRKSFLFTIPLTIMEAIFERKTKLITFKHNWHWYHTLLSETITLLSVRTFIGLVQRFNQKVISSKGSDPTQQY